MKIVNGRTRVHVTNTDDFIKNIRFDYDVDGNCIYKGQHLEIDASQDDVKWHIIRYDYDVDGNCTQKRFKEASWADRATGW